jgi:mitochondrial fission protein ELM1
MVAAIRPRLTQINAAATLRERFRNAKENTMKRFTILVVTALAAAFFLSPEAKAQGVPLLCKTSLGGAGSALITLSNLTRKTIPKGQTLFAKKGDETIKFEAAEDIRENGSVTYRTNAAAFHEEGDCLGWY